MTGHELRKYRREQHLTQREASRRLGVSQTYLSLVENNQRRLTKSLQQRLVRKLDVLPTQLPAKAEEYKVDNVSDDQLASDLATLGYPGFSHLKPSRPKNPADVLLAALNSEKRDARLIEALPWLLFRFSDLKWDQAVMTAKVYDLQNRMGFLANVAKRMAETTGNHTVLRKLEMLESRLADSKLAKEETLCKEAMTQAERSWLKIQRPEEAARWNLLTDLSPQHLNRDYYATA
jgi:transcriptional regulator with XRE-family HTH domain